MRNTWLILLVCMMFIGLVKQASLSHKNNTITASIRSFRAESLPELWKSLPRMKTVAQPFDRAEQVVDEIVLRYC